ncbi:MAG: Holliday junction branch migration protein RuvA [Alistipes sp.]|jgi:Holliday junction DNA helicase RuvA|nr:Holliday junction branch migration protein RuvA [Alistipes sp.]
MYEFISGKIADLTPAYAVVEAGGVGYYLNISLQTYAEIERLAEVRLWVQFIVREDAQILYGFSTREERELFRRLVSVSGVGGNTARMVLSTYSPAELAAIISSENALLLKNVKGLGLKTAEKIIVELRDKMTGIAFGAASGTGASGVGGGFGADAGDSGGSALGGVMAGGAIHAEALAALAMLGFARAASDKVVRAVMKDEPGLAVEELIRRSLKKL